MIHKIKLQKEFADAVLSGDKCFEIRKNDRGYQKGDKVQFKVMDGIYEYYLPYIENHKHPLSEKLYEITYVISGWGLENGFVVFGIREDGADGNNT